MDEWCRRRRVTRGQVLSLEQAWALAQAWYGDRLAPDFHGRSAAEAQAVFRRVGLDAPFWSLPSGS